MDLAHTLQILAEAYADSPLPAVPPPMPSAALAGQLPPVGPAAERRRGTGLFGTSRKTAAAGPGSQKSTSGTGKRESDLSAPPSAVPVTPSASSLQESINITTSKPQGGKVVSHEVLRALRDWLVHSLASMPAEGLPAALENALGALIQSAQEQASSGFATDDINVKTSVPRFSGAFGSLGNKKRSQKDLNDSIDVVTAIEDEDDPGLALHTLCLVAGNATLLNALVSSNTHVEPIVALCFDVLASDLCASPMRAAAAKMLANLSVHAKCLQHITRNFSKQCDKGVIRYASVLRLPLKSLDRFQSVVRLVLSIYSVVPKIEGNQTRADVAVALSALSLACVHSPFRLPEETFQSALKAPTHLLKWIKRVPTCQVYVDALVDTMVLLSRCRMDASYLDLRKQLVGGELDLKGVRLLTQREWDSFSNFDSMPTVSADSLRLWREQNSRLMSLPGSVADFEALCMLSVESDPSHSADLLNMLVGLSANDLPRRAAVLRTAAHIVTQGLMEKKTAVLLSPILDAALNDVRFDIEFDKDDGETNELSELVDASLTGEVILNSQPKPTASENDEVAAACVPLAVLHPNAPRYLERIALLLLSPVSLLSNAAKAALKSCAQEESLRVLCNLLSEAPVGQEGTARALEALDSVQAALANTQARSLAVFHAFAALESPAASAASRLRANAPGPALDEARVLARARLRPLLRMNTRRAFVKERANELVGCLRVVFACSSMDSPEFESVWTTIAEDAAGWPDWAVRRVARAVLTGLSPELAVKALSPMKSILSFVPELGMNPRVVGLVSALIVVALRHATGTAAVLPVVASLMQGWLLSKSIPQGESAMESVLSLVMSGVDLCTYPPGEEVVLLGPAPSASLPSFLLSLASKAREFDTKHIAVMGLLAERFGARLSVKDRADFLDAVIAWLESRPMQPVGIIALRKLVEGDPTLASMELVASHVLIGNGTYLAAVEALVRERSAPVRASVEHMGMLVALLLSCNGTSDILEALVGWLGATTSTSTSATEYPTGLVDAACAMLDNTDKLSRSAALASVCSGLGIDASSVVKALFSLAKKSPSCSVLAVPWLAITGPTVDLFDSIWALSLLGGGRAIWESALSGKRSDPTGEELGRFLLRKAKGGEDISVPWRVWSARLALAPDDVMLSSLPDGMALLTTWLQLAALERCPMSEAALARVTLLVLGDNSGSESSSQALRVLGLRLGLSPPASKMRVIKSLSARVIKLMLDAARERGLFYLFFDALEAHPTVVKLLDVALAAVDALLLDLPALVVRLERHLSSAAVFKPLAGAVLGPCLWIQGEVGTEACAALLSLNSDVVYDAAAEAWRDVRDDWPVLIAQTPTAGIASIAELSSKFKAPAAVVNALNDLARAYSGLGFHHPRGAVNDVYVKCVCAIFSWEDPDCRRAALKTLANTDVTSAGSVEVARAARYAFGELAATGEVVAMQALSRCGDLADMAAVGDDDVGYGPSRDRVAATMRARITAAAAVLSPQAPAPEAKKSSSTPPTSNSTGTTLTTAKSATGQMAPPAGKKRTQEDLEPVAAAVSPPDMERPLSMEWLEEVDVMETPPPALRKMAAVPAPAAILGDVAPGPMVPAVKEPARNVSNSKAAAAEGVVPKAAALPKLKAASSTAASASQAAPAAPAAAPAPLHSAETRRSAIRTSGDDAPSSSKVSAVAVGASPTVKPALLRPARVLVNAQDKPEVKRPSPISTSSSTNGSSASGAASALPTGTESAAAASDTTASKKPTPPPSAEAFSPIRPPRAGKLNSELVQAAAGAVRARAPVQGKVVLASVETTTVTTERIILTSSTGATTTSAEGVDHSVVLARPSIQKGKRKPPTVVVKGSEE